MVAYILGVIVVFVYFVITYIIRFLNLHNRVIEFENYGKVGMHYNFIKDEYYFVPSDENWHDEIKNWYDRIDEFANAKQRRIKSNIFTLIAQFIIYPLLSWISILVILYAFFNKKIEDKVFPKGIIEQIKKYQFNLKYKKLNKREIRIQQVKLGNLLGIETKEKFCGIYDSFTLNATKHTISYTYQDYEYKIKGTNVWERMINALGYENRLVYYIKDGIATNENPKDSYWTMEKRKEEIKRKPLFDTRKLAYILYYDENLSDEDFKNYIIDRVNNIELCRKELKKLLTKNNVWFIKSADSNRFLVDYTSDYTKDYEERKKEEDIFYKKIEKIAEKYNCKTIDLTHLSKFGKVDGTVKTKCGVNGKEKEYELDKSDRIPCIESTRDAFEPEILPFYRGLIQDI